MRLVIFQTSVNQTGGRLSAGMCTASLVHTSTSGDVNQVVRADAIVAAATSKGLNATRSLYGLSIMSPRSTRRPKEFFGAVRRLVLAADAKYPRPGGELVFVERDALNTLGDRRPRPVAPRLDLVLRYRDDYQWDIRVDGWEGDLFSVVDTRRAYEAFRGSSFQVVARDISESRILVTPTLAAFYRSGSDPWKKQGSAAAHIVMPHLRVPKNGGRRFRIVTD